MSSIFSRNCSPTKTKRNSSDAEVNISMQAFSVHVNQNETWTEKAFLENVGISKELPNPKLNAKQWSKSMCCLDFSCHLRNVV